MTAIEEAKIVDKAGAWLSYGDLKLGQGKEAARNFLAQEKELAAEIDRKIRVALNVPCVDEEGKPGEGHGRSVERDARGVEIAD